MIKKIIPILYTFFALGLHSAQNNITTLKRLTEDIILASKTISFEKLAEKIGHLYEENTETQFFFLKAYDKKSPNPESCPLARTINESIKNQQQVVPQKISNHLRNFFSKIKFEEGEIDTQPIFEKEFDIPLIALWQSGAIGSLCCGKFPFKYDEIPGNYEQVRRLWNTTSFPISQLLTFYFKEYPSEDVLLLLQPTPSSPRLASNIPLFIALRNQRNKLALTMIKLGANILEISADGSTIFHEICKAQSNNSRNLQTGSPSTKKLKAIVKHAKKFLTTSKEYETFLNLKDNQGQVAADYLNNIWQQVNCCNILGIEIYRLQNHQPQRRRPHIAYRRTRITQKHTQG